MTSMLNPKAKMFIPNNLKSSMTSKTPIILRPSKPIKMTNEQQLAQLKALSTSVAEKVFEPISHRQFEQSLKARSNPNRFERVIVPKTGGRLVSQIEYHNNRNVIFNLFWDEEGNRAIVDIPDRDYSWQYSDLTIRRIIHLQFIEDVQILNECPELDMCVSKAPLCQFDVEPE